MNINQQLSLETKLPFLTVQNFHMVWEINRHAELVIEGIAQSGSINRADTLKILLSDTGETLFYGDVVDCDLIHDSGVTCIRVKASSASLRLDRAARARVFQDPSRTYADIVREIITDEGGEVICTVGDTAVRRPYLCYMETAWQFAKRLASQNQSFLAADVITNRPNIWFGMRRGKEIRHDSHALGIRIKRNSAVIYYLDSRDSFSIGDWISLQGKRCMIFRKEAHFERGELLFRYYFANERHLETEPYYNESITGLSLTGRVREAEKEHIQVQFDVDHKSGGYWFAWQPETGNALYAMPEIGSCAEIYFPDHDEQHGMGMRCWERSPEDRGAEDKYVKTAEDAEIKLGSGSLNLRKGSEEATVGDASVAIKGSQIQIEAAENVRLKAKTIMLSAGAEIRATTE